MSCADDVEEVVERVAELADLERRTGAVEIAPAEVWLAEGEVDEGAAFAEDAGRVRVGVETWGGVCWDLP